VGSHSHLKLALDLNVHGCGFKNAAALFPNLGLPCLQVPDIIKPVTSIL